MNPGFAMQPPLFPNLSSRMEQRRLLVFSTVLACYLLLWSISNWPALKEAWWSVDDFDQIEHAKEKSMPDLYDGRVTWIIWYSTFFLEVTKERETYNILLRFFQGVIHSLAAAIASFLIWKQTRRLTAFLSMLPFLLWPFNGEAVLWRSAGNYPVAALLGLIGILAIWQNGRKVFLYSAIGSLCIVLAVLTIQISALAGLAVWIIIISLRILDRSSSSSVKKKFFLKTIIIVSSYIIAGLISYLIAKNYESFYIPRAVFATDVLAKLSYLAELNRKFIYSSFFPNWLNLLTVALLISTPTSLIVIAKRMGWSVGQVSLSLILLMSLFVIPYGPLLIIDQNWDSARLFYLSPLLIAGFWIMLDRCIGKQIWGKLASACILIPILVGYVNIARINSSDYIKLFRGDLQLLRKIENYELRDPIENRNVFVATFPDYVRDWNPYKLNYLNGDSKNSAFLKSWSANSFIRLFSSLKTTEDATTKRICLGICESRKHIQEPQLIEIESKGATCVCP